MRVSAPSLMYNVNFPSPVCPPMTQKYITFKLDTAWSANPGSPLAVKLWWNWLVYYSSCNGINYFYSKITAKYIPWYTIHRFERIDQLRNISKYKKTLSPRKSPENLINFERPITHHDRCLCQNVKSRLYILTYSLAATRHYRWMNQSSSNFDILSFIYLIVTPTTEAYF